MSRRNCWYSCGREPIVTMLLVMLGDSGMMLNAHTCLTCTSLFITEHVGMHMRIRSLHYILQDQVNMHRFHGLGGIDSVRVNEVWRNNGLVELAACMK